MNAKFGIYKDCASSEPTKVYECKRLLFGVSKKALAISKEMNSKTQEEQLDLLVDLLQTIFPEFEADEINFVDAVELGKFVNELVHATNAELNKSQKN